MSTTPAESLTFATDSLTVRGASVIGTEHQARGQVRQDAFAIAPGPLPGSVVVAVADGLGSTTRAEEAAALAVTSYVELLGALSASEAAELVAHESAWVLWAADAARVVADRLGSISAADAPARAATTLSAALVVPLDRTVVAWTAVGDSPVLVTEDGLLTGVWDPPHSNVTTALPQHPDTAASGLDAIGAHAGLLLLSDGMAEVLLDVPGLAEQLTGARTEPELLALLHTQVPGCHDDRTAVVVTRESGA